MAISIRQNLVPSSKYSIKCPYSMTPTRLVIHNTANDASAANEISYMKSNNKKVSFHYAVDDKEIVQGILENRNAWHAGDGSGNGNRQGIGIEICYSKSGGSKFTKAEQNAAWFAAELLKKYGWGIDRVTKHQDYSGKYCPHRTLDLGWQRFLNMIKENMSTKFDYSLYVKNNNLYMKILEGSIKENITVKNLTKGTSWKVFADKSIGKDGSYINQGMESAEYEVIAKGISKKFDNRPAPVDPKDQKIAELTKKVSELEGIIKNQTAKALEQTEAINRLSTQVGDLKGQIGAIESDKISIENENMLLIVENETLRQKVENQAKELAKLNEKLNSQTNLFVKFLEWLKKLLTWIKSLRGSKSTGR